MEAARIPDDLPERMRRGRFTAALEDLRPLGISYVMKHFGRGLDRADAEDVVAEVIIRFDRQDAAGRRPGHLRPAFVQSVKNASLDLLRYRGIRPTAPLEAAGAEISDAPGPEAHAESAEQMARLREALVRMNPGYREAIVLRFGADLSVPELAEQIGVSLPAAKKRVVRSTAQIRERMEEIEERRFCAEIESIPDGSGIDGFLAGISGEAESAAIKAHLEHCGSCRGFLAALRSNLHELGGTALLGGLASAKVGFSAHLISGLHALAHGARSGTDRLRLVSYRAGGAFRAEGADSAGLLTGAGQKIAAVCGAGVAGAATCAATGIVGPGLGVATHQPTHRVAAPPAHVREASKPTHWPLATDTSPPSETTDLAAEDEAPPTAAGPAPRGESTPKQSPAASKPEPKAHHTEAKPETASQTTQSQFGIEEESAPSVVESTTSEASAPIARARTVETSAPTSTASSSPSPESSKTTSSASGGHDEFGFGG